MHQERTHTEQRGPVDFGYCRKVPVTYRLRGVSDQSHRMVKSKSSGQVSSQVRIGIAFSESVNDIAPMNHAPKW